MAHKPIVIIHGWSDDSDSFDRLAKRLSGETGRTTEQIWLGDYISLDDDVRIRDIADALQAAWMARGLPVGANAMDAIVHSTGGLVIREWIHRHYTEKGNSPPVSNLVMLAPANFGSPLAHKGRSLIGRVVKGSGSEKKFQTGTHILKGLEMASPYSWNLAERDRFSTNPFKAENVRCTVIVGNSGYPGIKGLANEDGSDGTVYVSTANLNCARVSIEVARSLQGEFRVSKKPVPSTGRTAFLILDGIDHAEITGRDSLPRTVLDPILEALNVSRDAFPKWCDQCAARTKDIVDKYANRKSSEFHAFQNTVFRVMDDQGNYVDDYAVEFYGDFTDKRDFWARVFNRDISGKTHPYDDNPAYRSFMINTTRLLRELQQKERELRISLTAMPDIRDDTTKVGYRTTGVNDIGQVKLDKSGALEFFQPNRTLFVDILLPRYQKDELFRLQTLGEKTNPGG